MPDFQRSVRLLGRRPSTQQFIDTIIKKYGTHILISATLGGEKAYIYFYFTKTTVVGHKNGSRATPYCGWFDNFPPPLPYLGEVLLYTYNVMSIVHATFLMGK